MTTAQRLWLHDMHSKGIHVAPSLWDHQCQTMKQRYEDALK